MARVADAIVDSLAAHGVKRLYCVPGESYLALLDALHGRAEIATVACRHESGAGFMALAEAKLTGIPGVFAVSRGPGASNGAIAIHVAEQDAVPVLALIGQVASHERGRGAFQEVDYAAMFGAIAKGVWEVTRADDINEVMARAFHLAASGTPGPVVVSLPEDILAETISAPALAPWPLARATASPGDVAAIADRLAAARRPLIIAGGACRGDSGQSALVRVAEAHTVPVAVTWKNQDVFDNSHPLYAGHLGFGNPPAHREILAGADLILAVGARLGDVATQNYQLPRAPAPDQPLVHVYPDGAPIGTVFRTDLGIVADPTGILDGLAAVDPAHADARRAWVGEIKAFIDDFMAFAPRKVDDGVDFGRVIDTLKGLAPPDAVIITDAGNFSSWVHRHWRLKPPHRLLGAIGGAMGFAVPAAVAASLAAPERQVIAVVGDGGMLMTGQEIATAMATGAAPRVIVSNNASYATIRTHQERAFPGRVSATALTNPDFTAWAASFGAGTWRIASDDDIAPALSALLAHDGAGVVEVVSSLTSLSAFTTL